MADLSIALEDLQKTKLQESTEVVKKGLGITSDRSERLEKIIKDAIN